MVALWAFLLVGRGSHQPGFPAFLFFCCGRIIILFSHSGKKGTSSVLLRSPAHGFLGVPFRRGGRPTSKVFQDFDRCCVPFPFLSTFLDIMWTFPAVLTWLKAPTMKRRRLTHKQPPPAPPSSDELGQVRTLVRDRWVAARLSEHGRGGQDARAVAKREFSSASNKRGTLTSLLEAGQIPARLHAAALRLVMAWTSEAPLLGPDEAEGDAMSSYRGSGTMFRYSGSWSRVPDAELSAVLAAKGHAAIPEVCARLKRHPYVQGLWHEFSTFSQQLVSTTPIARWTAALELHVEASLGANPPVPSVHIHFMFDAIGKTISFRAEAGLKFRNSQPYKSLSAPVARGRACKRAYDQGHFYLTPLKTGAICHATNAPPFKSYPVSPEWITGMWQGDKLSPEAAKELYLKCKKHVKQYCDNVSAQVQMTQQNNLQERQAAAQAALRRMQRPRVYLEPVEQDFLPQFQVDMFRRRFLVLDGPTKLGKTMFASSLAGPERTLELNCASSMEPNLRDFDSDVHRAVVFDEASCAMVLRHKKLFQGGVQPLELASSNTNCYSYKVWVYGAMMIVTSNTWSAELQELSIEDASWLRSNSVHVYCTQKLYS